MKKSAKYKRSGEIIRYLTTDELQQFSDCIYNHPHELIFRLIYESGYKVGEFVQIQVKQLNL